MAALNRLDTPGPVTTAVAAESEASIVQKGTHRWM